MKSYILIFYMIIVAIHKVHSHCNQTFNTMLCVYDVYCQGEINLDIHPDNFMFDPSQRGMDGNEGICKDITAPSNYGYHSRNCHPIHLVYRSSNVLKYATTSRDERVPATQTGVDLYLLGIVTSLDLSNNNYELMPNLDDMSNLVFLNLSNNALSVATLFNVIELPSLTEIDFSHNVIKDIQWESNNKYRRLKKINLSYNYLNGIPETTFDNFDELETLDVSHNYIDTLGPSTFEGTKQLVYLNISFNRITDINSSLFRFNELKLLDLSNNKIASIKSIDFNKLAGLETLDLSFNFLTAVEKGCFQNMPLLNSLYLNNNRLENIDKETFTNVTKLVNIDISGNNFVNIPKGLFKNKNLVNFKITGNKLDGSIVKGTFEGLTFVKKMDLSQQYIKSIKDFSFLGLNNIEELLLNDNNIQDLSPKCFRAVQTLKRLDLTNNKIQSIEFEKDDLFNLFSLSLRNNHLIVVRNDTFHGLNSLQFLDLSDNNITQVETNSFKSLNELINFEISNNPLSGTLEERTFDGLNSLPSLDISCTSLSAVQNGSFIGMIQLKKLNVSHSKINTFEYNTFIHTGAIETLDLSFNELKEFYINSTELSGLEILYLNHNAIKTLDSATFESLSQLSTLTLSYNMIQSIKENTLKNKKYLRALDVSFNSNFKFTLSLLNETKNVNVLNLSGIKTVISFGSVKEVTLSQLFISNSSVSDVKKLEINELRHLDTLTLSHNDITKLETGSFNNVSSLKTLDMSHNKITYIQPGVFKDNNMIHLLNISHNFLTVISYGIFRGLTDLHTLDISFNNIKDLQNERFYEVKSLSILMADHNKIESITADEFLGTKLTQLSIGGNPIPCDVLVNLDRSVHFKITSSRVDENNDENVFGVTCNKKSYAFDINTKVGSPTGDNAKVLLNIRDILLNHFNNHQASTPATRIDEKYLANITNQIQISSSDISTKMSNIWNSTMQLITKSYDTNMLLNNILRVLTLNSAPKVPLVQVSKDNATYENLLSYINRVKQDLVETMNLDRSSILNEVDTKISAKHSHDNLINETPSPEVPKHENISSSVKPEKSIFTETCVALILIILVCFVLFKVYKSGIFVRRRLSISTRELPGAMDSTL